MKYEPDFSEEGVRLTNWGVAREEEFYDHADYEEINSETEECINWTGKVSYGGYALFDDRKKAYRFACHFFKSIQCLIGAISGCRCTGDFSRPEQVEAIGIFRPLGG